MAEDENKIQTASHTVTVQIEIKESKQTNSADLPVTKPPKPQPDRSIDIDEQEKRTPQQHLQRLFVKNVGQDPMLTPSLGDKLQQCVDIRKRKTSRPALICYRGKKAVTIQLLLIFICWR
jgi:hypothetical protein